MKSKEKPYVYYHGTDARFVRMSDTERLCYLERCGRAINYMWPFYRQIWDMEANIGALRERIRDEQLAHLVTYACLMHQSYLNGSGRYQYGDLYLTSYLLKAADYALEAFAGGEFARIAYRLYQGALELNFDGWNPDDDFRETARLMCRYADEPSEPVIFKFENLDLACLTQDNGNTIDFSYERWSIVNQMVRYTKPLHLDLTRAAHLPPHFKRSDLEALVNQIESQ